MTDDEYEAELKACTDKILNSDSPKKLIVAGPGTGKTTFFRTLINDLGGHKAQYLVLTFIVELVKELEKDLGEISHVSTFHGYCHLLLRRIPGLRKGLNEDFEYYPGLIKVVKSDWEILHRKEAPDFIPPMRKINPDDGTIFFIERANFYNAVGFEDSVFRVHQNMDDKKDFPMKYKQIIIDEFQDFNKLEVETLGKFIKNNPVLIVGDDDQALYCVLRGSDPQLIRDLYQEGFFETFSLPFCHRCPEAVIAVFKSILANAKAKGYLKGRIDKKFEFYPLSKRKDSEAYPSVKLVEATIQNKKLSVNYLGRYVLQEIQKIPKEEIDESYKKGFPTVLIIGPKHFLESIIPVFDDEGYKYEIKDKDSEVKINLEDAIKILKKDNESNLGWRIVLEIHKDKIESKVLEKAIKSLEKIKDFIPDELVKEVLEKVEAFKDEDIPKEETTDMNRPRIKLTTFEGAKGLSAQHVFIVGFQNGILPRKPGSIDDMEICKLLVALTRARKQCYLMTCFYFGGQKMQYSEFIKWLGNSHIELVVVNKKYWNK